MEHPKSTQANLQEWAQKLPPDARALYWKSYPDVKFNSLAGKNFKNKLNTLQANNADQRIAEFIQNLESATLLALDDKLGLRKFFKGTCAEKIVAVEGIESDAEDDDAEKTELQGEDEDKDKEKKGQQRKRRATPQSPMRKKAKQQSTVGGVARSVVQPKPKAQGKKKAQGKTKAQKKTNPNAEKGFFVGGPPPPAESDEE